MKKIEKKKKKSEFFFFLCFEIGPKEVLKQEGGSLLYYQRPQSVFEEDEAKEATEKKDKKSKKQNKKTTKIRQFFF